MKRLAAEPFKRRTLSFYRYVILEHPEKLRDELFESWNKLGVLGRVYLAHEGINAQISIPEPKLDELRKQLDATAEFKNVPFKIAIEEPNTSFWKLVIKVRKQIVADGLSIDSYDITNVGKHLDAKEFNEAIESGATVVDMRNKYESDIGHFASAVTPTSQRFIDELPEVLEKLADKKDEKILLYCTGGIRCEKASAYLRHHGFKDVNQLHGGIIQYKHDIEQIGLESKFLGKNYVFDGRMAEAVTSDVLGKCFTCGTNADSYDNCANDLCHALFIQCASCKEKMFGACSTECSKIAALPIEEKKKLRQGKKATFKVLSST